MLPVPAGEFHDAGGNVLKYGQHCRVGSKGHEQKEEAPPEPAQRKIVEYIGQGHKDQGGALVHRDAVGRAGGEDDQARAQGHGGVQDAYPDGFSRQGMRLVDVAAEDRHGADAQTQGKERLIHGTYQHIAKAHIPHSVQVWQKEERKALRTALQSQAVPGQNEHHADEQHHHRLCDFFQSLLNAEGDDQKARDHHNSHEQGHFAGRGQHSAEHGFHPCGVQPGKSPGSRVHEILEHPSCHGGVEHHQHDVAQQAHIAVKAPAGAGAQLLVHFQRTFLGGTAHGKFNGQCRHAQNQQENQIGQDECPAAVLPCHPGEFPNVSDTNGAACAEKKKAQPAAEMLPLHTNPPSKHHFVRRL